MVHMLMFPGESKSIHVVYKITECFLWWANERFYEAVT